MTRIHVRPLPDGRWMWREETGWRSFWYDLRCYGVGVALYNLWALYVKRWPAHEGV
jgi:hypothetical protein